ncbi:MAG: 2-oxoacid:acceptor oxidoreductase subunit alpha [Vicingaceae bacterium]
MTKNNIELNEVVVKFAGDSGDGMQLTGSQLTATTAFMGNDLATFPDFPAEIRAPQGTVAGVSGFKIQFGNHRITSPGDKANVLVAMNPAALKANITAIEPGSTIIVDIDSFTKKDLEKAKYDTNPLEDGTLEGYKVVEAPITSLTKETLKDVPIENRLKTRSKNMFALGMVYWMFNRTLDVTNQFIEEKFKTKDALIEANKKCLLAGYNYALTIEAIPSNYIVKKAALPKGKYRNITGNQSLAWGFIAAAEKAGLELFLGSYPITPASDILHELSKHKDLGVKTFQAEDEIAAVCAAIGASYAGALGLTTTSGPGLALKSEAIGLAVMTELPLVVVDVQRGGPSTGLPTKTEQADLMQALYGRNGECPAIVIAAGSPSDCFYYAYYAAKLALEHVTPVILLSDGYIANGSAPWNIPKLKDLPDIIPNKFNGEKDKWQPYLRDDETLARKWVIPGTDGLEHRIGGLEKEHITGNVSYDPLNHQKMVDLRDEKIKRVASFIDEQKVYGPEKGDLLIVGWGGTFGNLLNAYMHFKPTKRVAFTHFNFINPLPKNTKEIFKQYKTVLVCELNKGQFAAYLRSQFPEINFEQYNKVQGLPFTKSELVDTIDTYLK